MSDNKMVQLNVRVPRTLKDMMQRYVESDTHKDISELTRDALREKLVRDVPDLFQQFFQESKKTHQLG